MTYANAIVDFPDERGADLAARKLRSEHPYLVDLIAVLREHPAGLRRWSVMRAIRRKRETAGQPINQKFEDDVERAFRRFCADSESLKNSGSPAESALFFKPQERAGEVWALYPDRADAWLRATPHV